MIAYTTVGTNDFDKAKAFYGEFFEPVNAKPLFNNDRFIAYGTGPGQPMFGVCLPHNQEPAQPGNGAMVTLGCANEAQVQSQYAKAIELGGTCEGQPGLRADGAFYLAYFRDLDGNKIALFCPPGA